MRTREEIENEFKGLFLGSYETKLLLEVILDNRDFLIKLNERSKNGNNR